MFPDKVWETILEKGGLAAAIVLFVVFGASVIVYKLWQRNNEQAKEICKVREDCDRDVKAAYEARLTDTNRQLDKAYTVVSANTSTLADNSRVVESRAEAITAMKEVLTKLVIMQESDAAARRSQADRIETNQAKLMDAINRLMDVVRPPPKSGL